MLGLSFLPTYPRLTKKSKSSPTLLESETFQQISCHLEKKPTQEQIEKCMILSPAAGEVTYANRKPSSSSDGILIEEGKQVRERQTIIRLPDTSHMRVFARVSETKIEQVKPGMVCSISITRDGFRGVVLSGKVDSVSDYPVPSTNRYAAHIKEYSTEILIENPPDAIKAGMSAKVTIMAESIDDALLIPLSAVVRQKGHFYCLIKDGDEGMVPRSIELGSSNTTHAVLLGGLGESDEVVVNPDSFPEHFEAFSGSDLVSR